MSLSTIAGRLASATLLGTLAFGAAGVGTAAAASSTHHASISVASTPAAASNIRPGASFTNTLTVSNQGDDPAKDVALQMMFDPAAVQLQSVQFNRTGAWVATTMANGFQADLGRLGTHGDSVSLTATFVALAGYPTGTPLQSQLDVSWRDTSTDSGHHDDIKAPMLAGTAGQPSAATSTPSNGVVAIDGVGFQPGEAVTFWYNLPDGTAAPLYLRHDQLVTDKTHKERVHNTDENKNNSTALYADASGQISTSFATAGLAPGAYSIVAHGVSSGSDVVISFLVNY